MKFVDEFEDEIDSTEDWEGDAYFYEKEDWAGLLNFRKEKATKEPSDLYAQLRYAEALNLNKKFCEAIEFLTPLYKENHGSGFAVHEILDALYGLNKNEDDFIWQKKPRILKLDNNILELCVKLLTGKRKHVSLMQLFCDLLVEADYLKFDENELSKFLVKNEKLFDFIGDKKYYFNIEIKLKKQKK
ncbi:MAG: hypothetical protein H0V01_11510 [Bacteroidetes bacterium]|nr:hypothetical protein [Bacteroidota bacterium]MBA3987145.1 hypothetical protein [Flavobacteriales bacterium]